MGLFVRETRASDLARARALGSGGTRTNTRNVTSLVLGPQARRSSLKQLWNPGSMLFAGPALLLALATYGHTSNPTAFPAVGLLGAVLVRVAAQRGRTALEQRFARYVGCAVVVWLFLAWPVGPYELPLIVPMVVLAPGVCLTWAVYRKVQTLPTIDWPSPKGHARSWRAMWTYAKALKSALDLLLRATRQYRRMVANWPHVSSLRQIGLYGSTIVGAHWTKSGPAWVRMDLVGGRTLESVRQIRAALEVEWKVARGTLRPRSHEGMAHQIVLEFRTVAQLTPPPDYVEWPGKPPKNLYTPVVLGEFGGRRRVELPLIDPKTKKLAPHMQITGQTGWGKGSGINCLLAETALIPEWEHWGIDVKGGLELGPWEGLFRELADDDESAQVLVKRAIAEMKRRWGIMRAEKTRVWIPSQERPLIMFVVDEWAELSLATKDLLDTLLRQARASGFWLALCTQRVSAHKTGGTGGTSDAKSQLGMAISYYQVGGDEALTFGDGARREGWRPDQLERPGRALIRWAGRYNHPDPWQTYWVSDEVVADVAAKAANLRREWSRRPDVTVSAEVRDLPARTPLLPAGPAAIADTDRPELHLVTNEVREDPRTRLRVLVASAPEEGVKRADLLREMTGVSDSWIDQELQVMKASGEAVKVGRARWRGAGSHALKVMGDDRDA